MHQTDVLLPMVSGVTPETTGRRPVPPIIIVRWRIVSLDLFTLCNILIHSIYGTEQ
jgi:hypothetical protein